MTNAILQYINKNPKEGFDYFSDLSKKTLIRLINQNKEALDEQTIIKICEWNPSLCSYLLRHYKNIVVPDKVILDCYINSLDEELVPYISFANLTTKEIEFLFQKHKHNSKPFYLQVPIEHTPEWFPRFLLLNNLDAFYQTKYVSLLTPEDMIAFWEQKGDEAYRRVCQNRRTIEYDNFVQTIKDFCKQVFPNIEFLTYIGENSKYKEDIFHMVVDEIELPEWFCDKIMQQDYKMFPSLYYFKKRKRYRQGLEKWYQLYGTNEKACKWAHRHYFLSNLISLHGELIQYLPEKEQLSDLQLAAVKENVLNIQYIQKPTKRTLTYIQKENPTLASKYIQEKQKLPVKKERTSYDANANYLVSISEWVADEDKLGGFLLMTGKELMELENSSFSLSFGNIEGTLHSFKESVSVQPLTKEEYEILKKFNINQVFGHLNLQSSRK